MKLVRKLAAALLLACALTVNVYAGDQHTPGYVEPPPPPPPATELCSPEKTVPTGSDGTVIVEAEASDDLLITAIMALLSVF